MPHADPRFDAYIAKAQPFARPILEHLRALVGRALPEAEETIKWGMPHWTVKGKNLAGMAAFKAHSAFTIHGEGRQGDAMGNLGRVTALADLPDDAALVASLRAARERLAVGAPKRPRAAPKPEIAMPDDFAAALGRRPATKATFDRFAPSHRREYLEWVTEAKRAETRAKRIAQAIEWIAEGKKRNWKYETC